MVGEIPDIAAWGVVRHLERLQSLFSPPAISATTDYTGWESWMEPYRVFVSIRHPFTMYVSLWKFICRQVDLHRAGKLNQAATAWWFKAFNEENPTFPEFICHGRMRREMRQFLSYQHHIRKIKKPIDHFVRQERLQEDIRLIPGLESVDVPRNNVSPKDSIPWHAYYDEELVNRLLRQSPGNYRALGYTRSFKNAKEGRFFTEEE